MEAFREEQRLAWFWTAIFCAPALITGYGLYRQMGLDRPFLPDALLVPAFIVTVVVAFWFSRLKLITEVRDGGLFVSFVWLWPQRTIAWDQIRSVATRAYRPIRDGGYGVRWVAGGIAYCARSNQAVCLVLASGERVLIGSARAVELAHVIAQHTTLPYTAA